MTTIKHIDLDEISLSPYRPHPAPPSPALDLIDIAQKLGIDSLTRMRVRMTPTGYELITGIMTYSVANALQIFHVPVEVMELDDEAVRSLVSMDYIHVPAQGTPVQMGRLLLDIHQRSETSIAECGRRFGLTRREASLYVRLTRLDNEVIDLIESGKLSVGCAKCLITLPPSDQTALAHQAVKAQWTTKKMESVCQERRQGILPVENTSQTNKRPMHVTEQEQLLGDVIGSPVEVIFDEQSKVVSIHIRCSNLAIYEGVAERLIGQTSQQADNEFHV